MRGRYQRNSPRLVSIIFILVVVLAFAVLIFMICRKYDNTHNCISGSEPSTDTTVEKNPDAIAVPGYEMLELKAGSKEQSLCMPNPPQNCCYFQIALYLEDGTLLWKSELIEPGTTSKPMVLTKALDKGMYPNAILRYSCYRMDDDLAPLNGAETKLTLWVK